MNSLERVERKSQEAQKWIDLYYAALSAYLALNEAPLPPKVRAITDKLNAALDAITEDK